MLKRAFEASWMEYGCKHVLTVKAAPECLNGAIDIGIVTFYVDDDGRPEKDGEQLAFTGANMSYAGAKDFCMFLDTTIGNYGFWERIRDLLTPAGYKLPGHK